MITFRVFLLHEHTPKSYTYLKSHQVDVLDEEPVTHLKQTALEFIKSHSSFRHMKLLEVAEPEIYLVRWLCGARIAQNFILGLAVFGAAQGSVAAGEAGTGSCHR